MLNIAICDDNLSQATEIENHLLQLKEEYNIQMEIEVFSDGMELDKMVQSDVRFDIVYLDIEMKYMNGIETAKKLREVDQQALVIYISSHQSYVFEIFESRPFYFMRKPINWNDFDKWFELAYVECKEQKIYFEFTSCREQYRIKVQDILYFESSARVIKIICKDGQYEFYGKLKNIEKEIKELIFLRVHQSYLVNIRYIQGVSSNRVLLTGDFTVPVSENRRKYVKDTYSKQMWGKMK